MTITTSRQVADTLELEQRRARLLFLSDMPSEGTKAKVPHAVVRLTFGSDDVHTIHGIHGTDAGVDRFVLHLPVPTV